MKEASKENGFFYESLSLETCFFLDLLFQQVFQNQHESRPGRADLIVFFAIEEAAALGQDDMAWILVPSSG